jgi:hypothetical protein
MENARIGWEFADLMEASAWRRLGGPQRVRTYLILFALAVVVPLLGVSIFALNRMAAVEQEQL